MIKKNVLILMVGIITYSPQLQSACNKENKKISIDELRHHTFSSMITLITICLEKLESCTSQSTQKTDDEKVEVYVIMRESVFNSIVENLKWAKEIAKKSEDDPTQFSRSDLQNIIDESELRLKTVKNLVA